MFSNDKKSIFKFGFFVLCVTFILSGCTSSNYNGAKLETLSEEEKEPITILSFSLRNDPTPEIVYSSESAENQEEANAE